MPVKNPENTKKNPTNLRTKNRKYAQDKNTGKTSNTRAKTGKTQKIHTCAIEKPQICPGKKNTEKKHEYTCEKPEKHKNHQKSAREKPQICPGKKPRIHVRKTGRTQKNKNPLIHT